MKPEQVKTRLQRQVEEAKTRKEQARRQDDCPHEWETVEESLPIDNDKFKKFNAYFVFRICSKCQRKVLIDYRME